MLQIRWNLWKKNEERQVEKCTKEQEGNLPPGNGLYVIGKKKKIALLKITSVKAMPSGNGLVTF